MSAQTYPIGSVALAALNKYFERKYQGPPGTGKTSLCKALAQKLSIRMNRRYRRAQLIEINSHSLFSRWFSESGKLVMKMFDRIRLSLEDKDCIVFVLIDEVESLTASRAGAMARNEPSDAVRVVNALLTQLDFVRRWPNVLVLTTSNLAEAIDPAFADRADLQKYIGNPGMRATEKILQSCIDELQRVSLIDEDYKFTLNESLNKPSSAGNFLTGASGLSGRMLRKLPLLALSRLAQFSADGRIDGASFVAAMQSVLAEQNPVSQQCQANGISH